TAGPAARGGPRGGARGRSRLRDAAHAYRPRDPGHRHGPRRGPADGHQSRARVRPEVRHRRRARRCGGRGGMSGQHVLRRPCVPGWRRVLPWLLLAAGLVAGLGLQTRLYSSDERTVSTVLMYVALAAAWNLIGGFTGYACFGQVAFFGLGGYATAVLMSQAHMSFWEAMPMSAALAALFAGLVGAPLLRLKGHYFAVATLEVAEGLREVVTNMPRITGGGAGITIPTVSATAPTRWLGNDGFYLLFLGLAVAVVGVNVFVSTSRGGYALRAIHQDEDAAGAMGINTTV